MRVVIPSHVATFVGSGEMAAAYVIARARKARCRYRTVASSRRYLECRGSSSEPEKRSPGASETWSEQILNRCTSGTCLPLQSIMAANRSGLTTSTMRNLLMAWVMTMQAAILLSGSLFWVFSKVF